MLIADIGRCVGLSPKLLTKRGKGTKIVAIADASGLSVADHVGRASPHEVHFDGEVIDSGFTQQ